MRNTIIALSLYAFAKSLNAAENTMDIKAIRHYQISIEPGIYGLYREGPTVFTFPGEQNFVIKSTYNSQAKEDDQGFGSLHNPYDGSERLMLEPKEKMRRIRAVLHLGTRWAFLDSVSRQFVVYDEERKVFPLPTDLILDTARPPRDAKGEATRAEREALQRKIAKELSHEKGNPDLIAGLAPLPKKWKDKDGSQYVIWLRGTSTPLLTLKCDPKEFKTCVVQRACLIKGMPMKDFPKITSLSLDPKLDTLQLLMPSELKILTVKGSSCHDLAIETRLRLPKSLAFAQGLFIDTENNYWLSLKEPEGSTSASVFVWGAKSLGIAHSE